MTMANERDSGAVRVDGDDPLSDPLSDESLTVQCEEVQRRTADPLPAPTANPPASSETAAVTPVVQPK
jgi:hypothetical protein